MITENLCSNFDRTEEVHAQHERTPGSASYDTITLSASGGFQTSSLSQWFTWPSRFWAIGPALSETLIDGGLRQAQTAQARASYEANVASYRQTVLTGFQEVEDNLAAHSLGAK